MAPPMDCRLKGDDDTSASLPLRGGDLLVESLLGGEAELMAATVALLLPNGEVVVVVNPRMDEEGEAAPPTVALRLAGEIDLPLVGGERLLDPLREARRRSVDSLLVGVGGSSEVNKGTAVEALLSLDNTDEVLRWLTSSCSAASPPSSSSSTMVLAWLTLLLLRLAGSAPTTGFSSSSNDDSGKLIGNSFKRSNMSLKSF